MAKIYDLKQEQLQLLDELFWIDESDESAELLKTRLASIYGDVNAKLNFLSDIYAESLAQTASSKATLDEAKKRLESVVNRNERNTERLKQLIMDTMDAFNIDAIDGKIIRIKKSLTPQAVTEMQNFDLDALPDELIVTVTERRLDRAEVSKILKAGVELPGLMLTRKLTLRVS